MKKLAEEDRNQMPNELIQGMALTVRKYNHLKIIYLSLEFLRLKHVHHH